MHQEPLDSQVDEKARKIEASLLAFQPILYAVRSCLSGSTIIFADLIFFKEGAITKLWELLKCARVLKTDYF